MILMYTNWVANSLVVIATAGTVALAVLAHYEGLRLLGSRLQRLAAIRRQKVLYGVYGVVLLHVVEIWLFGLTYWMLLLWPETGSMASALPAGLLDSVYLSAMTYTTVGFGDLAPLGPVRFLSGTEALTGFVMITWSASFTYLEMERFWRR
jgi:hypothetical protein